MTWGSVGCSPTDPGESNGRPTSASPSEKPNSSIQKPLDVIETSYWPTKEAGYWRYLVLIENPNDNFAWYEQRFEVEAFDDEGLLLGSYDRIATVLPGATLALTAALDIGASSTISYLEVRGPAEGVRTLDNADVGSARFSDLAYENDAGKATVSGIATSSFDEDNEDVAVVIVIRDKAGKVVEADWTVISRLPGNGKARFVCYLYSLKISSSMTIEAYLDL
jgi:hypothetical protein